MTDQPVTLVGNSMGGLVSMLAAIDRPDTRRSTHSWSIPPCPWYRCVPFLGIPNGSFFRWSPYLGSSAARYYYHEARRKTKLMIRCRLVLSHDTEIDPLQRAAAIEMARARPRDGMEFPRSRRPHALSQTARITADVPPHDPSDQPTDPPDPWIRRSSGATSFGAVGSQGTA